MKNIKKSIWKIILAIMISISLFITGCEPDTENNEIQNKENIQSIENNAKEQKEEVLEENTDSFDEAEVIEDEYYSTKEDVSMYLVLYDDLPPNFITKNEAKKLGWNSKDGNLWDVTDMMSIGGDKFGNREGNLPRKDGRQYFECDIDYYGGFRGSKRLVYSNDGLIYYTDDHYKTFTLIYGEE